MTEETTQMSKVNIEELMEQLTKRNQQYMFDLKKTLTNAQMPAAEQQAAFAQMLPQLVESQKAGTTARQLFGTVSEQAEKLMNKPAEVKTVSPFLMWVDNVFLILGLFGLIIGLLGFISKGKSQPYGLITLFMTAVVGGWVFYLMYKYMYQYEQPGADKSKRPKMWRVILILVSSFFLWIATLSLTAAIPVPFNPILSPLVLIMIGFVSLIVRYYLKKKYNIVGSLTVPKK